MHDYVFSVLDNVPFDYFVSIQGDRMDLSFPNGLPEVGCPYQAIDKCSSTEREPCCIDAGAKPSIGQAGIVVSIIAMLLSLLMTH